MNDLFILNCATVTCHFPMATFCPISMSKYGCMKQTFSKMPYFKIFKEQKGWRKILNKKKFTKYFRLDGCHDFANVLPKDARKLRKILDITLIFGVFLGALVGGTLLTLPGGILLWAFLRGALASGTLAVPSVTLESRMQKN